MVSDFKLFCAHASLLCNRVTQININRVNGEIVLKSDTVYYRNSVLGNLANGTAVPPVPLIDYDSLPDNVIIPNGGLTAYPTAAAASSSSTPTFSISLLTKIVGTGTATSQSVETATVVVEPVDWENRKKRRSIKFNQESDLEKRVEVKAEAIQKRATASSLLPITFMGMKWGMYFLI